MAIGDEILIARLTNRETQLSQQADALDVKASILLVAITFLAGQSTYFLSKHPTGFIHWNQLLSVVVQIVAGCLLAWQLYIKTYPAEASEKYPQWRDELIAHFGGDQQAIESEMTKGIIEGCTNRAKEANRINEQKATVIQRAYWLSLSAFACNLAALVFLIVS
jgi:hypothetical protein